MSKLDKEQVLAAFTAAYKQANGKEPSIEAKGGWYSVDGGKNVRLAQLDEMTREFGTGEQPAAKAKPAKAKPAKAKAKARPASKGGFSVKQYWASKITEANTGAILPR